MYIPDSLKSFLSITGPKRWHILHPVAVRRCDAATRPDIAGGLTNTSNTRVSVNTDQHCQTDYPQSPDDSFQVVLLC
jgi:hypothetical protein